MLPNRQKHRVWAALLAAVLLLCVLTGCTGSVVPQPTPVPDPVGTNVPDGPENPDDSDPVETDVPDGPENPDVSDPVETDVPDGPENPDDSDPVETDVPDDPEEPDDSDPVGTDVPDDPEDPDDPSADPEPTEIEQEAAALSESPAAVPHTATVEASGVLTKENSSAVIDYSNMEQGYVMVQYTAQTSQRLKVQVKGPTTKYTYNITPGQWAAFPLSDGNGAYQITVYQNVTGSKYASVLSLSTNVTLKDQFAPFLHSNQYVDYDAAPKTAAKAAQLTAGITDPLKKVEKVYDYVVQNVTYDKKLAASVQSGYLPVLDKVLEKQSGICFDYAALMTGMLRSQGVPCKLVVGYAGTAYHAWISVWTEDSGWIDGVIWFDGADWQRMDPTFASSADSSSDILAYIGDGANYTAKYFY